MQAVRVLHFEITHNSVFSLPSQGRQFFTLCLFRRGSLGGDVGDEFPTTISYITTKQLRIDMQT